MNIAPAPDAAPIVDAQSPIDGSDGAATPTPAAQLTALQRSAEFSANWKGDNGRAAQKDAVERKSAMIRRLHGPADDPTSEWVPEQLQDGLDNQNSLAKATAEAMQPANSRDDFSFNFTGTENMELQDIADLKEIASEASFAAGASPAYARATVEYVDAALARSDGTPATVSDLESAMSRQFGDRKEDIQAHARATIARMPERSQQWIYNTLERLPASDGAWLVNRLSTVNRASGPKN